MGGVCARRLFFYHREHSDIFFRLKIEKITQADKYKHVVSGGDMMIHEKVFMDCKFV